MGSGSQAEYQDTGIGIAEGGYGLAPVFAVRICAAADAAISAV